MGFQCRKSYFCKNNLFFCPSPLLSTSEGSHSLGFCVFSADGCAFWDFESTADCKNRKSLYATQSTNAKCLESLFVQFVRPWHSTCHLFCANTHTHERLESANGVYAFMRVTIQQRRFENTFIWRKREAEKKDEKLNRKRSLKGKKQRKIVHTAQRFGWFTNLLYFR